MKDVNEAENLWDKNLLRKFRFRSCPHQMKDLEKVNDFLVRDLMVYVCSSSFWAAHKNNRRFTVLVLYSLPSRYWQNASELWEQSETEAGLLVVLFIEMLPDSIWHPSLIGLYSKWYDCYSQLKNTKTPEIWLHLLFSWLYLPRVREDRRRLEG